MDRLFYKHFLLCLTFLLFSGFRISHFPESDEWKLKKSENGILVYSKNEENSSFKELKSVMQIKASLSSVMALLNDWESYPHWVYRCEKSATLKQISETELIHYQTVKGIWPVESRDFVVKIKIVQDPVTKAVKQTATCMAEYFPKQKNHVRITEFKAAWTLVPLKNGYVFIEYQLFVNPGGTVPAWLVNLAAIDGPYETMHNLKDWVVKEKYQKAKLNYIQD
jgi:ribosome-associated toxin RatA of RatAB toxin-antitoxin module